MPAVERDAAIGIDPYGFASVHLSAPAHAALVTLRDTLERSIRPLMSDAWERAIMPDAVREALIPLELMQPAGVSDDEASSSMFSGFRNYVLARTDVSVATLYNAQSGLFRTTIRQGGSPAQVAELDRRVRSFSLTGTFALTEPDHGSDIAGGMATTARLTDGGESGSPTWILDGAKRWIGAAGSADVIAVFARSVHDGHVKAFLVPRDAPGLHIEPLQGKVSLRPMQNAVLTFDGVQVAESSRLHNVNGWRDVSRILRAMRSDVAWIATGLQAGALDAALRYVTEREQFGRPIGGLQLVQEKLARILGNLTASLGMVVQLSAHQDAGHLVDHDSALAKMQTARMARESVALAREVAGGNGILLEHDVARFFADAEAVYSYEGTHEITSLIVGRALTGASAFV